MKKAIGSLLLIIGIGIIMYTLFISYEIVSGERSLPDIFPAFLKKEEISSQKEISFSKDLKEMEKLQQEMIAEQISKLFPPSYIQRIFNLIAWSIMSAIFIFGGAQLATIGIRLIK